MERTSDVHFPLNARDTDSSLAVTLVHPFLNMSIHMYTIHSIKTMSPYRAHSFQQIFTTHKPLAHKNWITACNTSLVVGVSRVAMLMSWQKTTEDWKWN
jgi:hypothetical protein